MLQVAVAFVRIMIMLHYENGCWADLNQSNRVEVGPKTAYAGMLAMQLYCQQLFHVAP